jgi:excisionase family DNA binding protein
MSSEMDNMMFSPVPMDKLIHSIRQVVKEEIQASGVANKSTTENQPYYLSPKKVAAIFNISLPTVRAWTKEGRLKSYRMGRRVLYKSAEIALAAKEVKTSIYSE